MEARQLQWPSLTTSNDRRSLIRGGSDSGRPPVFLHTGWRTGGTWLWSRFRALPGVTAYYEPLNTDIATLSHARINQLNGQHWRSYHPILEAPYFEEFRPLLRTEAAGVRLFDTRFASENFFAEPDAELPGISDYLHLLLQNAAAQRRQPVLKFCDSLGRIGWMQRTFPQAIHIVLLRNPTEQFASARQQLVQHDNAFFLTMPWFLLGLHRDQPLVAAALRHLRVDLPPTRRGGSQGLDLQSCEIALRQTPAEDWYRLYLAFWIATNASVPSSVDLIINYDMLALSAAYRRQTEIEIMRLTGCAIDLDDVHGNENEHLPDRVGLTRAELWQCHRAVETLLFEQRGKEWCNDPALACLGAMLQYAMLLSMDGGTTLQATACGTIARWDALMERAAAVGEFALRAAWAERRVELLEGQLAAVYASRSWTVTAPLRRLRECLLYCR
jgi:hypothetical protein